MTDAPQVARRAAPPTPAPPASRRPVPPGAGPEPPVFRPSRLFRLVRCVPGVFAVTVPAGTTGLAWLRPELLPAVLIIGYAVAAAIIVALTRFAARTVGAVRRAHRRGVPAPVRGARHLLVVPNLHEDEALLRGTLGRLAAHRSAREDYVVVLAMEEAEAGGRRKAETLRRGFAGRFHRILVTHHRLLPHESAGKSANLRHAVRTAYDELDGYDRDRLVVTVLDADTVLPEAYLAHVAARHRPGAAVIYAPPISFQVNSASAAPVVRLTDQVWSAMVLASLALPGLRFPCAVYSLGLDLAHRVGFWDAGPEATGEDLHMTLKCYVGTGGRLRVRPVPVPVGCHNVTGRSSVAQVRERHRQTVRHMFGAIDLAYAVDRVRTLPVPARTRLVLTVAVPFLAPQLVCWFVVGVPVTTAVAVAAGTVPGTVLAGCVAGAVATSGLLLGLIAVAGRFGRVVAAVDPSREDPCRFRRDWWWLPVALFDYWLASVTAHVRLLVSDRLAVTVARK